ncbi:hypothetical protein BKA64DRAFT_226493 [Cadophora sp. MPI-SDFR-AT-0126]|nr:hypothetical protein BKA64DRAFT_226493 [Leotiomycetes sp. MPI-SDFR-AT-0126]
MRDPFQLLQLNVASFFAFLHLASISVYAFDRGDRYWSGRPLPIGIDFTPYSVVVVLANGTDNFTTLGNVLPERDNQYASYMHGFFLERSWSDVSSTVNDDDHFLSESWLDRIASNAISGLSDVRELLLAKACRNVFPDFLSENRYHDLCEAEDVPQRPKSKYGRISIDQRRRLARLRLMKPKWFRSPQPVAPTKSGFIFSAAELLEGLKRSVLQEHNITITSAIVSRPSWMFDENSDMIDEACVLAGIEVLEQPHSRPGIATWTLEPRHEHIVILDNGPYHLDVIHAVWDEAEKSYKQTSSMEISGFGSDRLGDVPTDFFEARYNISVGNPDAMHMRQSWLGNIDKARRLVKFWPGWRKDQPFACRSISINLEMGTDWAGSTMPLNVTGQDVLDLEEIYMDDLVTSLKEFHLNVLAVSDYSFGKSLSKIPRINVYILMWRRSS